MEGMVGINIRKIVLLLVHVLAWLIVGYALFYHYAINLKYEPPTQFLLEQTMLFLLMIGLYYLNTLVLIPRLMFRNKQVLYVVILILCCGVQILVSRSIDRWCVKNGLGGYNVNAISLDHLEPLNPFKNTAYFDKIFPMLTSMLAGLGIVLSFTKKWQQEVSARQQLENEKTQSELLYLKAQINPHFFFNTLNNIYSFTLTDGNTARIAIANLSKMMRYVLYDAQSERIKLSKEVAFIQEYIDLMKLRLTDKMTVTTSIDLKSPDALIAPMILQPFVENAFKHGTSTSGPGYIDIFLIQSGTGIIFMINNTIAHSTGPAVEKNNGVGLVNTKRRLELLYPGKYKLSAQKTERNNFEVKLNLELV
jgi:two-component system LytT family sensor kinase